MAILSQYDYTSDIDLDISGDFKLDNSGDFTIISDEAYYAQEIELLFRSSLNFRSYIGYNINGPEGAVIGDAIRDDVQRAIDHNPSLQNLDFVADVTPLPDNQLLIDITNMGAADDAQSLWYSKLDFSNGQLLGYEPNVPSIDSVYDQTKTPIMEKEFIHIGQATSQFEVSHMPSSVESILIYKMADISLNLDGTVSGIGGQQTTTIYDAGLFKSNQYNLYTLFPEGYIRSDNLLSLTITNENDEIMDISLDGMDITINELPVSYTNLTFNVSYGNYTITASDILYQPFTGFLMEGKRLLFPHDRLIGKSVVQLDIELLPDTYFVTYQRYPQRTA